MHTACVDDKQHRSCTRQRFTVFSLLDKSYCRRGRGIAYSQQIGRSIKRSVLGGDFGNIAVQQFVDGLQKLCQSLHKFATLGNFKYTQPYAVNCRKFQSVFQCATCATDTQRQYILWRNKQHTRYCRCSCHRPYNVHTLFYAVSDGIILTEQTIKYRQVYPFFTKTNDKIKVDFKIIFISSYAKRTQIKT